MKLNHSINSNHHPIGGIKSMMVHLTRKRVSSSAALGLFLAFNGTAPISFAAEEEDAGKSTLSLEEVRSQDDDVNSLIEGFTILEKCNEVRTCHDKSHEKTTGNGGASVGSGPVGGSVSGGVSHDKSYSKESICKLFSDKRDC